MKKSLLSLAVVGLTAWTSQAQAETVLTVSSWLPPSHTASMAQKEWCDLLENNTKGRIKCNILPRGVTPAPGTYDAVRDYVLARATR
jgi:TRAP-type C4-dicarboxylate transport system substrate-binding protein